MEDVKLLANNEDESNKKPKQYEYTEFVPVKSVDKKHKKIKKKKKYNGISLLERHKRRVRYFVKVAIWYSTEKKVIAAGKKYPVHNFESYSIRAKNIMNAAMEKKMSEPLVRQIFKVTKVRRTIKERIYLQLKRSCFKWLLALER